MAREFPLPPSAASLSASMRDIGYSLETAVADLIDNSITAGATAINILCDMTQGDPILAISDNGRGMHSEEMVQAMRHGSSSPKTKRHEKDLGRFGLGLKTASFSQCKQLTVISAQENRTCAAEWNLDLVDSRDEWLLLILDDSEIAELPFNDQLSKPGTIVLWRNLDRLTENSTGEKQEKIVYSKLDQLGNHLSLVFHRFLSGEAKGFKKVSISINGHKLDPFDPFCRHNSATQSLPKEIININGSKVVMHPYVLPHFSKLSAEEYDFYQNRSNFITNQGAYIYRNSRLMAWGDWFRLVPKGEATKLARVQIDFPNTLDESWAIDIKKSRAWPPSQVRERLAQIIEKITGRSTAIHKGRGAKLFNKSDTPMWERQIGNGIIQYILNRDHPLMQPTMNNSENPIDTQFNMALDAIESSLPLEMIYSDFSENPNQMQQPKISIEEAVSHLKQLKLILFSSSDKKYDPQSFKSIADSIGIFHGYEELIEQFANEELK